MYMNEKQVKLFLPHRDPFLFIDFVESVSLCSGEVVGATVVAHFKAREDLDIFRGHFPGRPILPGVVQVEMIAQATAFVITKILDSSENLKLDLALLSVAEAKFRRPILPGMPLIIKTVCRKYRGSIMAHDGEIFHGDELMSQASILAQVSNIRR